MRVRWTQLAGGGTSEITMYWTCRDGSKSAETRVVGAYDTPTGATHVESYDKCSLGSAGGFQDFRIINTQAQGNNWTVSPGVIVWSAPEGGSGPTGAGDTV